MARDAVTAAIEVKRSADDLLKEFKQEISRIENSYNEKVDEAKRMAGNVSLANIQNLQADDPAATQRKAEMLEKDLRSIKQKRCYETQNAIASYQATFRGLSDRLRFGFRLYATQRNLLF
jgi:hypothetical protein